MTYSVQYSLADNMQRAGMNTLMGIGIVFLMLVFLSFVIGLFKYIDKIQNAGKKKAAEEAPKAEAAPAPAIAQSEAADEDFADDLELVAVIPQRSQLTKILQETVLLSVQSRNQINGTEPDRRI